MSGRTFASVCSGIGAPEVAWSRLGWSPVFASEIERFPSAVLAERFPNTPNRGDMRRFEDWPDAAIDVLVGGTPCQDFSVAGLRAGLAGDRANLALVYLEIARRFGARWLVWENVPGVLSSNGGRDFGAILGGMVELGYGVAYRVLDAQFFGVAQRRRRVFVVGYLGDWRRAAAVLLERDSLQGNPAPRREPGQRPAGTLEARLGRSCGMPGGNSNGDLDNLVAATLAGGSRRRGGFSYDDVPTVAHSLRAEGFDASEDGTGRGVPLISFQPNGSGTNLSVGHDVSMSLKAGAGSGWGNAPAIAFHENQRAEITVNDTAGSLKVGGGKPGQGYPAIQSGKAVRRLTPRECERLQGFPDDWTLIPMPLRGRQSRVRWSADGARYKAIGNSMAVPVMQWIGRRIDLVDELAAELTARPAA